MLEVKPDDRLKAWWTSAEPLVIVKREQSEFVSRTAKKSELTGSPSELALDDGKGVGKRSIAGSGHAVRFETAGDSPFLTRIRIHGSRYGTPQPPKVQFQVWLCDADFNAIKDFKFPYSTFKRGDPEWVNLDIPPSSVPSTFIVCVGFNPAASKGVYVFHDAEASGGSLTGMPGRDATEFDKGDWLIRVGVDQLKSADALRDSK
jgi:RNA polymerase sigma-70 factor (ECF subfamily)